MIAVPAESRQSGLVMPRFLVPQALGFACLLFGCGPNVQMIYEGNVRFEHCYRLDLDPTIAPAHRRACWQDWLARHTYAQSGDRLNYARQRLGQIDNGQQATLMLQIDGGTSAAPTADAVPMPSSVHAAPPPRAPEPTAAPSQAPPPPKKAKPLPEAECSDACMGHWNDCAPSCDGKDKPPSGEDNVDTKASMGVSVPLSQKNQKDACVDCRRVFRACMRKCYK